MTKEVNRRYKDTVFRMLFSDAENALSLYNGLNGTAYTDIAKLQYNTMENAIYMNVKNDVSFLIGHWMHLYEHQSTWNTNMPLCSATRSSNCAASTRARRPRRHRSPKQNVPTPGGTGREYADTEKRERMLPLFACVLRLGVVECLY